MGDASVDSAARSIVTLVIIAGAIVGQVFLSRSESKVPGLVLPTISLAFAAVLALNVAAPPNSLMSGTLWLVGGAFLLANIPTAILLALYFAVRAKKKRNTEVERMRLQDLK